MTEIHAVLGTGPLGLAVVRLLAGRGETVRAVNRSGRAEVPEGVEVAAVDLADPQQAGRACRDAAVVYHCAGPPYHRWAELHPRLMAAIIEGATSVGARLVFGDNLYAYGPVDGPLTEDLPYRASGPNGTARGRVAEALVRAHEDGRVRAAIVRGSDFFGPQAHLSSVGDRVFARALAGKPAQVLGNPDIPHSVTYLADFARALVAVGEREEALGQVWHAPSTPPVSMRRFVELVFEEVERPMRLRAAPRWGITLASLVSPTMRALREQLYQHEQPWVVDSSRFERSFGWGATPLPEAIRATVAWFRQHAAPA